MDKIIELIKNCTDILEIRTFKKNAEAKGNMAIIRICNERIIKLGGINENNPLERRFKECLAAYEEVLYEKSGKGYASRLRPKWQKNGTKQTIIDAVNKKQTQEGLKLLLNRDSTEFSMESIVLEFPNEFPNETVKNAKIKLSIDKDVQN
jgi:hypothetical protein